MPEQFKAGAQQAVGNLFVMYAEFLVAGNYLRGGTNLATPKFLVLPVPPALVDGTIVQPNDEKLLFDAVELASVDQPRPGDYVVATAEQSATGHYHRASGCDRNAVDDGGEESFMKWIWTWVLLLAAALVGAESVTIGWRANTEINLVGYRVYAGTNSRQYQICIPTGLVTTQRVELPEPGRWFFAVTATNNAGRESAYSAEVVLEPKPEAPVMNGEPWVKLTPIIERSTNLVSWQSVTGAPTWFPATNGQEFFAIRRLEIERVDRVEEQ